ncbi:hypothetical protein AV521_45105 [Streptomyces sp. IMTB 2501]|uniref:type I polyketide synthase n=1 Tax=Streptomyces sp. IMTB 2501 TaxID=1776340 RepID=UPI00096FBD91|nr:type I polyketide synthase [Streptomyces sp. IMTB 2501]OLZ60600.1 hypothetical protein AV521_45105 [Streptomyces sp. IMTB 2501]
MADEEKLQKYLRKATAELRQVRGRLTAEEEKNREPIAIIGIGCRFPGGVRSPEDLWELVDSGGDAISGLPVDRGWNLADRMPELRGGFLYDAHLFDPEFFGMEAAEARAIDPQQRLLLETSWEAFERAGIDPVSAKESRTAVYTGIQFGGYPLLMGGPPPAEVQDYIGFGSSGGAASGRISYLMGLLGGSLSVDTQCSSSLVAVHLAVKALRNGEATLALAGGASVMSLPSTLLDFHRRRTTSPDGRSKSFAAAADGVSLSEGVAVLLLERLSDARRNHHPVLAVVRGSAINQDGSTNGMWAPRTQAQEQVIRQALADARLTAGSVDVVEGHGVGATLGDGVEAQAIITTYGEEHSGEQPVRLGSVKSNIGHTQTVGGVAGITKIVMAMRHQRLPKTLHVDRPTTHADWSAGTVRLLTEAEPWPAGDRVRRAGVSCLTLSGTNAHVVLEEAPAEEGAEQSAPPGPLSRPVPWIISAKTRDALREQAGRIRDACAEADVRDTGAALYTTRSAFRHRAVVVGQDRDALLAGLDAVAHARTAGNVVRGVAETRGKTALMYSGSGLERPGAGGELYEAFPAFAQALDEVCVELDRARAASGDGGEQRPLRDRMLDPTQSYASPRLARAAHFAFGIALHRLVEGFGVAPEYVTGLGVGEVAAAHAAGILSLPDACSLAVALIGSADVPAGGASVWIQATEAELRSDPALGGAEAGVVIAAVDEPGGTVVSGDRDQVEDVADRWSSRGRATGPLRTARTIAPSGQQPSEAQQELRRTLAHLAFDEAAVAFVSGLDGETVSVERLRTPEYWTDHARRPTRFLDAARHLQGRGVTRFLEVGPNGELTALARRSVASHGEPGRAVLLVGSQGDDGTAEAHSLLTAIGTLHTDGVPVRWSPAFEGHQARRVDLPTSPFQYQRHWLIPPDRRTQTPAGPAAAHPLLGAPVELATGPAQWFARDYTTTRPDASLLGRVHGTCVLSSAALVEWALAAARHGSADPSAPRTLRGVELHDVLAVPDGGPLCLQTLREASDDGVLVRGFARTGGGWTQLVSVSAAGPAAPPPAAPVDLESLRAGLQRQDADAWYARLWRQGVEDDREAAAVTELWCGKDDTVALVRCGESGPQDPAADRLSSPPVLKAGFTLAAAFGERRTIPVSLDRFTVHEPLSGTVWVHARRLDGGLVTVTFLSEAGHLLATLEGVGLRPVREEETSLLATVPLRRHDLVWQPLDDTARTTTMPGPKGSWLVYGADDGQVRKWRAQLAMDGIPALAIVPGDGTAGQDGDTLSVSLEHPDAVERLWADLRRRGVSVDGLLLHCGTMAVDGADGEQPGGAAWQSGRDCFSFLQRFLRENAAQAPRIVLCSTGAAAPVPLDAAPPSAPQTLITALARTVIWEYPHLAGVQVDLEPGAEPPAAGVVVRRAAGLAGSGHLAVRADRWYEARIQESPLPESGEGTVKVREDATYLVLGGKRGTDASAVVDWLAERGARSVVMAGCERGAQTGDAVRCVEYADGDFSDPVAVTALLERIDRDLPPLRGVIHLADAVPDAPLDAWDWDGFSAALSRALGAPWHFHRHTRELDFFVLSSAITALPGRSGQAVATAADAFFEALARHRRHAGLSAVSVAWGPWQGAEQPETGSLQESGIHPAPVASALDALGQVLAGSAPRIGLARVVWQRYLAAAGRSQRYAPLEAAASDEREQTVGFGQRR